MATLLVKSTLVSITDLYWMSFSSAHGAIVPVVYIKKGMDSARCDQLIPEHQKVFKVIRDPPAKMNVMN